jgi:hypothetical protein
MRNDVRLLRILISYLPICRPCALCFAYLLLAVLVGTEFKIHRFYRLLWCKYNCGGRYGSRSEAATERVVFVSVTMTISLDI